MDLERTWALFKSNCHQTKLWFDEHPALILVVAMVILWFTIFRMNNEKSSVGMWSIVVICVFLVLYAFGQMSGLGFGMSF